MDPETSRALASLKSFVQPPPISNRTLAGFGPTASPSDQRPSQVPPPLPSTRRSTAAWNAHVTGKQPPPPPRPRRATPEPRVEQPVDQAAHVDEDAATIERPGPAPATPSMVVERPRAPVSAATRPASSSWVGWGIAGALFVLGMVFYAASYAPLRSELSNLEQATAAQLKERDEALAALRQKLTEMQRTLDQRETSAPTAAEPPAVTEQHAQQPSAARVRAKVEQPRVEAKPAEPKAAEPKAADPKKDDARTEQAASKSKAGFDRAAAAAATAALEAQEYGTRTANEAAPQPAAMEAPKPIETPKASEPAAEATKKEPPSRPADEATTTTEKKDSLADIEKGPTDDPLEGL
jgi:hypothetical protein